MKILNPEIKTPGRGRGRPKKNPNDPTRKKNTRSAPALSYIRPILRDINQELKIAKVAKKFYRKDVDELWEKSQGRCAYCGRPLNFVYTTTNASPKHIFHIPLNIGGKATKENLFLICRLCKEETKPVRKSFDRLFEVDTFADLCEALFRAVQENAPRERITLIKRRMNAELEMMASLFRYTTTGCFMPEDPIITKEEESTLPDFIETLDKENITKVVGQTVATKIYKIVRKDD